MFSHWARFVFSFQSRGRLQRMDKLALLQRWNWCERSGKLGSVVGRRTGKNSIYPNSAVWLPMALCFFVMLPSRQPATIQSFQIGLIWQIITIIVLPTVSHPDLEREDNGDCFKSTVLHLPVWNCLQTGPTRIRHIICGNSISLRLLLLKDLLLWTLPNNSIYTCADLWLVMGCIGDYYSSFQGWLIFIFLKPYLLTNLHYMICEISPMFSYICVLWNRSLPSARRFLSISSLCWGLYKASSYWWL